MLEIAYTMHRGRLSRHQEDCLLIQDQVYQQGSLPIVSQCFAEGEVLLAVADGVHSSPTPHRASRLVLEELIKAIQEHPEWRTGRVGRQPAFAASSGAAGRTTGR